MGCEYVGIGGSCVSLASCLFAVNSVASAEETKAGIAFIWDVWIDASSGFVAYGRYWEMNDAAYRLISWGVKYILATLLSLTTALTQAITGLMVGIVVVILAIWLPRTMSLDSKQVWDRCLLIVTAVFLLSPTGFPWYYLWVVPFLAISAQPSLLLLNCMLPLYYLVYYYRARGTPQTFDSVVIWAQYLPFWGLALLEWLSGHRRVRMTLQRLPVEVHRGQMTRHIEGWDTWKQ